MATPEPDYSFGPYTFDGRLRRLYKNGEAVVLTPKAVDTLVALIERAGRVVEKDEILRTVWGDVFVGEETLAQNISTLRRAFGDDPNSPQFIATVPRRGYKFIARLRVVRPEAADVTGGPSWPGRGRALAGAVAACVVLIATAAALVVDWLPDTSAPQTIEFAVTEPAPDRFSATGGMLALSPDGAYLTLVVVNEEGSSSLWLRPLASAEARPLPGTEGGGNPFWSPDSHTIGFFSERRLKAVDVVSGAVRVIAPLSSARSLGATWSRTGEILFSVPDEGMYLVSASGGSPQRIDAGMDTQCADCAIWPHFLPDSRHFLFTVAGSSEESSGIYVGDVEKPGRRRLVDAASSSTFVDSGYLSYARAGTLFIQRFDPERLRLSGTPIPIADGVAYNTRTGRVLATTSSNGVLAFRRSLVTQLIWVDRTGRELGRAAAPGLYLGFSIAPDGRRAAAARIDARTGTSDIWVFDGDREIRVTDNAGSNIDPVWSADGHYVAYSSRRGGRWRIYRRQATAIGPEELLLETDTPVSPLQILRSADLVYSASSAKQPFDVWKLGAKGSAPLAQIGGFFPADLRLSPDEQWLAFGRPEGNAAMGRQTIYVSAAPFGETRRAIADAASMPRWRQDGQELFYLAPDSSIVSVPINSRRTPDGVSSGALFKASSLAPTGVSGAVYDAAPDGSRFLLKREAGPAAVRVVVNWDSRIVK